MPEAQKMGRKPGWEIVMAKAKEITGLTEEEFAAARVHALRSMLHLQVIARLEEIIPKDHEYNVVVEILKADIRSADMPLLDPMVTRFVLDRLEGAENVGTVLEDLGGAWRVIDLDTELFSSPMGIPLIDTNEDGPLTVIAEASLAEAAKRVMATTDLLQRLVAMGQFYAAFLSGPFGAKMVEQMHRRQAHGPLGFDVPIVVEPGESLEDAFRRAGLEVCGFGGPHGGMIKELFRRKRGDQPKGSSDECTCGTIEGDGECPVCVAKRAAEDTPPVPPVSAEDPFGDQ